MKIDKTDIKISVVIPVYNAEEHISALIESLKAQTMKELEFIFVDDCSIDGSMSLVSEWAQTDSRVRILRNMQNLGEGESRNQGLEAAHGLYVNSVDPDDWVAPDYFELLYAKAVETAADLVKGTRIKIIEETHEEAKPRSNLNRIIADSLAKGEPLYLSLHYEHQTLIIKRNLLDENTRYGRSGNAADTTFLLRLCTRAASFAVENRAYYYYLQRKNSATGEYSLKRSRNELVSLDEQISHFLQGNLFDRYVYQYCAYSFYTYAIRFLHACEGGQITPEEKTQYTKNLKDQLLRLPDYEKLYPFDLRIPALIDQEILLATSLYNDIFGMQSTDC